MRPIRNRTRQTQPEIPKEYFCHRCQTMKPVFDEDGNLNFVKNKNAEFGFAHLCKECDHDRSRDYYRENKAKVDKKNKKWQKKNHDKHLEHVRNYYQRKREQKNFNTVAKLIVDDPVTEEPTSNNNEEQA